MAHFKTFSVFQTLVLHLSQRLGNIFHLHNKLNWYVQIKITCAPFQVSTPADQTEFLSPRFASLLVFWFLLPEEMKFKLIFHSALV